MNFSASNIDNTGTLSFEEKLDRSAAIVLEFGEELLTSDAEDITIDQRITTLRLMIFTLIPVYRIVMKNIRLIPEDPEYPSELMEFRERLEYYIGFILDFCEKLGKGEISGTTMDQRIITMRLLSQTLVPVYRIIAKSKEPKPRSNGSLPDDDTDEDIEAMIDQLCEDEHIINQPELDPQLKEKLITYRDFKRKKLEEAKAKAEKARAPKPFPQRSYLPGRQNPYKPFPSPEEIEKVRSQIVNDPAYGSITEAEIDYLRNNLDYQKMKFGTIIYKPIKQNRSHPPSSPRDSFPDQPYPT